MSDYAKESLVMMFVIITFGLSAVALTVISTQPICSWRCGKYEATTGRNTRYVYFDSCYVESRGTWYTLEEYKMSIAAKDSLTFEVE